MKGGCLFRQPPFFGDVMWKKGNVLKNGWWLWLKKSLDLTRHPEEEASSAGEQLAEQ